MRIFSTLSRILVLVAATLMAAATTIVFVATISRYFLQRPIAWAPDYIGYMLCVIVFCCIPVLTLRGGHVSIDFLMESVPDAGKDYLRRLLALASGVTLALFCVILFNAMTEAYRLGSATAAGFPLPQWWFYAAMLSGFALSAVIYLVQAVAPARLTVPKAVSVVEEQ